MFLILKPMRKLTIMRKEKLTRKESKSAKRAISRGRNKRNKGRKAKRK
jgi:hypothetical protein